MRQLWGEAEAADADVVEEAADVVAMDDVGAWGSNPPRLKPTITKEARRLPKARAPKGGERGGRGGGGYGNMENSYKKWKNWNACYSYGFDVPGWHTSRTCPWECRKDHHQETYTRGDYDTYVQAGWLPSRVGKHKKYLPIPGTEHGN